MHALVERWNRELERAAAERGVCALHFSVSAKATYRPQEEFDVSLVDSVGGTALAVTKVYEDADRASRKVIDLRTMQEIFYGLGLTSMTLALAFLLIADAFPHIERVAMDAVRIGTLFVARPYAPTFAVTLSYDQHLVPSPTNIDDLITQLTRVPAPPLENVVLGFPLSSHAFPPVRAVATAQLQARIHGAASKLHTCCEIVAFEAAVRRAALDSAVPESFEFVATATRNVEDLDLATLAIHLGRLPQSEFEVLGRVLTSTANGPLAAFMVQMLRATESAVYDTGTSTSTARWVSALVDRTLELVQALDAVRGGGKTAFSWTRYAMKKISAASAQTMLRRAQAAARKAVLQGRPHANVSMLTDALRAKSGALRAKSDTLRAQTDTAPTETTLQSGLRAGGVAQGRTNASRSRRSGAAIQKRKQSTARRLRSAIQRQWRSGKSVLTAKPM
jgi:hypothetical protein